MQVQLRVYKKMYGNMAYIWTFGKNGINCQQSNLITLIREEYNENMEVVFASMILKLF